MREYTPSHINSLQSNEVFVFGSNAEGFHGAGSAGMACRGEGKNSWRDDDWFVDALKTPLNSKERIGAWAILGQAHGYQKGHFGASYAIETIKRPGLKRSTSLGEILVQLKDFSLFAHQHPELKFLVTKIGSALAGYTEAEIAQVFKDAGHFPDNVILPEEYEFRDS